MNENKTERLRVERAEAADVAVMFTAAENNGFQRKKFTPVSDVSHLEIYQYAAPSGDKLAVVYDTKARILTADGKPEALAALKAFLPVPGQASVKLPEPQRPPSGETREAQTKKPPQNDRSAPPRGHRQKLNRFPAPVPVPAASVQTAEPPAAVSDGEGKSPSAPPLQKTSAPPTAARNGDKGKSETKPASKPRKKAVAEKKTETKSAVKPAAPKPVAVPGVTRERLDWMLKDLKSEGAKVRVTDNADKSRSATVQSPTRESVSLVLTPDGIVTLTGKPGGLLADVKAKLESKSDLRLLKKYVPTALRYLSEPSKIDLSNGITDLNSVVRLSDYSVLLTAPYRALEKFIYDLQQAENINVKMIGQAYEKDDEGRYRLKRGYTKRIDSVVYAEVMTALYTEYFATRNFYTHSDNSSDSKPRGIADKAEAQRQLAKLLSVIEYNAKKLSEIGFSVVAEHGGANNG